MARMVRGPRSSQAVLTELGMSRTSMSGSGTRPKTTAIACPPSCPDRSVSAGGVEWSARPAGPADRDRGGASDRLVDAGRVDERRRAVVRLKPAVVPVHVLP